MGWALELDRRTLYLKQMMIQSTQKNGNLVSRLFKLIVVFIVDVAVLPEGDSWEI
jgi:hypothetical protein